jgi:ribonuclease HI
VEVHLRRLQRQAAEGADRHRELKARLSTDGGARGNPGPAAFGYVIESEDGDVLAAHGETIGRATNNVAEYSGLVAGMAKAAELGVRELEVVSDSELLVKQMRGEYKVKNAGLQPLHARARLLVGQLDQVKFEHVRREFNKEADRLSNLGMDAAERQLGKRA